MNRVVNDDLRSHVSVVNARAGQCHGSYLYETRREQYVHPSVARLIIKMQDGGVF